MSWLYIKIQDGRNGDSLEVSWGAIGDEVGIRVLAKHAEGDAPAVEIMIEPCDAAALGSALVAMADHATRESGS